MQTNIWSKNVILLNKVTATENSRNAFYTKINFCGASSVTIRQDYKRRDKTASTTYNNNNKQIQIKFVFSFRLFLFPLYFYVNCALNQMKIKQNKINKTKIFPTHHKRKTISLIQHSWEQLCKYLCVCANFKWININRHICCTCFMTKNLRTSCFVLRISSLNISPSPSSCCLCSCS